MGMRFHNLGIQIVHVIIMGNMFFNIEVDDITDLLRLAKDLIILRDIKYKLINEELYCWLYTYFEQLRLKYNGIYEFTYEVDSVAGVLSVYVGKGENHIESRGSYEILG